MFSSLAPIQPRAARSPLIFTMKMRPKPSHLVWFCETACRTRHPTKNRRLSQEIGQLATNWQLSSTCMNPARDCPARGMWHREPLHDRCDCLRNRDRHRLCSLNLGARYLWFSVTPREQLLALCLPSSMRRWPRSKARGMSHFSQTRERLRRWFSTNSSRGTRAPLPA